MAPATSVTSLQLCWTIRMTRTPITAAISSDTAGASSCRAQPRMRWPQGRRGAGSSASGSGGRGSACWAARSGGSGGGGGFSLTFTSGHVLVAAAGPGHVEAELAHGRLGTAELGHDPAVVDDPESVGHGHALVP